MLLINFTWQLSIFPLSDLITFFTNWALMINLALSTFVLLCADDKNISKREGWLAATHILFEIATMSNVVVVIVYWSSGHKLSIAKYQDDVLKQIHMYLVHTFPAFVNLIIIYTTDIQMIPSHWKSLVPIAVAYFSYNCYLTLTTGVVIYAWIDW